MNCDQVFDILTRGPFPTGTPCDAGVEAHLNICPGCRRLAEALRPALELFQEAVGPEESRDLPGYWCAVATDRKPPAVSSEKDAPPRPTSAAAPAPVVLHRPGSALAAWRLVSMVALGIAVGSLLSSRAAMDRLVGLSSMVRGGRAEDAASLVAPPKDPKDIESRFTLAEHKILAALPAACFGHRHAIAPRYTVQTSHVLANADLSNLNCCSECHNSNSDTVGARSTAAVAQSCQICHRTGDARGE